MLLRCLTTSGDRIAQIDLHICSSVFRPPLPCTRHQRRGIHAKIMALPKGQPTVSVEWLNANIRNVKVLDATWYLPTVGVYLATLSETHCTLHTRRKGPRG